MPTFTYDKKNFLLDDRPFRILSGAMHYFRVLPEYWEDRMIKLVSMGLNTLETYIAWNIHEPSPGNFHFDGSRDIVKYIECADRIGLKVIVRPGPYICTEWDFGGLPAWLLKDPSMRVRCMYQPYIDAVDRYFDALMAKLVPLQITNSGPIIAMQIENEYGEFGNDLSYLKYLEHGIRARGIDILLFTSDEPTEISLRNGTLPGVLKTINLSKNPTHGFEKLKEYQSDTPEMVMEFWDGWFDHWGEGHHTRSMVDTVQTLEEILSRDASVNFYMFHGGTNFGFWNGANSNNGKYQATTTSYDYDAPLNEAGEITPKYLALKETINKYSVIPPASLPPPVPRLTPCDIDLDESISIFDTLNLLSLPIHSPVPQTMEAYGQDFGFILYRTHLSGPQPEQVLTVRGLHDRAQVFVDRKAIGILERESMTNSIRLELPDQDANLDILVENMGRVNYGPDIHDRKGITEGVLLGQIFLYNWQIYPLPLQDLSKIEFKKKKTHEFPAFFRGNFFIEEVYDTFLSLRKWNKGVCWINGFNLGRYWTRGPQISLYLPAPLLKPGENEIVILELHGTEEYSVELCDEHDLE